MNDYGVILAEEGSPNWTLGRRLLSQSAKLLSGTQKQIKSTHTQT